MKETTFSSLVKMDDPQSVLDEATTIYSTMFPGYSCETVVSVFVDIVRLFHGEYPGYRECNTEYHDLKHTTDSFLAMARLIHGATIFGECFTREEVDLGLVCALMHDTGYIQTIDDHVGTGAKYTGTDTQRSIVFMGRYIDDNGLSPEVFKNYADVLICASLDTKVCELNFESRQVELLCKMLGTADLMGQMADRTYLEKLLLLYYEFREGEVNEFKDELDLLKKTTDFYAMTRDRFANDFGGVSDYARHHFRVRWNIDKNLYMDAIESNIKYLAYILEHHSKDYRSHLRRDRIVGKLKDN